MINVLYVEDILQWQDALKELLLQYGIAVTCYRTGDALVNAILADNTDTFEAVLVDWWLYEDDGETRQLMQGDDIYEEIKKLKPYLPQYVVTQEDDLDRITNTILARCHFRRFFSKKWIYEENRTMIEDFVNDIRLSVQNMRTMMANLPQHASWDLFKPLYFEFRFNNKDAWEYFEAGIMDEVERIRNADFDKKNTIARKLSVKIRGAIQIKNILLARRVILSELLWFGGCWHDVEVKLGYEEEPNTVYENQYRIYDGGFRTHCNALGFRPDELRTKGQGLLLEEKQWLQVFCSKYDIPYGFPIT